MMFGQRLGVVFAVAILGCWTTRMNAEHWPQFRGTNVDGIATSDCPVQWEACTNNSKNILWKVL